MPREPAPALHKPLREAAELEFARGDRAAARRLLAAASVGDDPVAARRRGPGRGARGRGALAKAPGDTDGLSWLLLAARVDAAVQRINAGKR